MLFKSSVDQAINVYNALSDAYSKFIRINDSWKVVERMEERDVVSWTTLITAYAQIQECEKAMEILSVMRAEEVTPNKFTFASILVTFEAKKAFNKIGDPDIVSWTAIISDYAQHGLFGDAIQLFEDRDHGGMADEGLSFFQSKEELVPEMEQYTR
ncbi:Pentatricopeptide repeat-containing protein [Acorus calamus]|uniref:Pentatricopeptide repeat-containing protein n=1 Tax=Acorus calamus TaxID=4465 RepID=A0AAV9CAZ0_ACOCL|nr:Pentatricopeptide repeat-containing protein [Acorus calamus]